MSNAIRYDSLLVRALAAELDVLLSGARLEAAHLDRDRQLVVLRTRAASRSATDPPSLLWQLHPATGHLTAPPVLPDAGGRVQLARGTRIERVRAPADERVLIIELQVRDDAPSGVARRMVVELITNRWNALAVGGDGRIVGVLRERATAGRSLRAGADWQLPEPSRRLGATTPVTEAEWLDTLGAVAPAERQRALLRFAYTGPDNVQYILGRAAVSADSDALLSALARYRELVDGTRARPGRGAHVPAFLLRAGNCWQPYPAATAAPAEPVPSLLAAFALAAERAAAAPQAEDTRDAALSAVADRVDAIGRRMARLRDELSGATQEAALRRREADLLLAQLHRVERGRESVDLDDFEGGTLRVEIEPSLSGADNANRLYDVARKRELAARRIPKLLASAAAELARLNALLDRIREDTVPVEELERLTAARPARARRGERPVLPYREYRSSRGLEIRVGRGSKGNDDLTFRHSSPSDVWLHARDVAGAHVILRWPDASANPPAADIAEAAVLAALHSRARTSGLVAVDWTRRKYVRKPRKAPPGLVVPERVRTVFVEPDAALEVRLRADEMLSD